MSVFVKDANGAMTSLLYFINNWWQSFSVIFNYGETAMIEL